MGDVRKPLHCSAIAGVYEDVKYRRLIIKKKKKRCIFMQYGYKCFC